MTRRPHSAQQAAGWWRTNAAYRRYMLREATSLPLLLYSLLLISGLFRFTQGEAAFADWLQTLRSPLLIAFHGLALAAAIFHAWTWIELVPKILVIHTARFQVSGTVIKRVHQVAALACFLGLLGLVVVLMNRASVI